MALKDSLTDLLSPAVSALGFYLEEVHVSTPGNHRIVTCVVDGNESLNLDQVTFVTRAISDLLDPSPLMGETPFTLEVTSPGVDRPLTLPRHFAKNKDRLVTLIKSDGSQIVGRIHSNTDSDLNLVVSVKKEKKELIIPLADIKKATVEIEFSHKGEK